MKTTPTGLTFEPTKDAKAMNKIVRTREYGRDPEKLAAIISSSTSRFAVERVSDGFSFDCQVVTTGPLTFVQAAYEGEIWNRRQAAGDKLVLLFPQSGGATIHMNEQDLVSAPSQITIVDSAYNKGMSICGPRSHLTAVLSFAELQTRLSNLFGIPVKRDMGFHPEIDISTGPGLLLKQLANLLNEGLRDESLLQKSPMALTNLVDGFLNHLLFSVPHAYSKKLHTEVNANPRHVKRAIEFMRSHISQPITLEQIVAASGAGMRALQLGFRQFQSATPMGYLRNLRLEAVQAELASNPATTSVSDVATKWGFAQMGRFAADYHARFGELPSQTLRNRRQ